MVECFRCGATDKEEQILEAIYRSGVVHICVKCYPKFRIPIVEKKKVDWEEVEKRVSFRERFGKVNNLDANLNREKYGLRTDDVELKDLVEKNFNQNKIEKENIPSDLVENFHWTLMRARRSAKMTQAQLGEKVFVPEMIINSLEKGILPKDYKSLIRKIESVLEVKLLKDFSRNIGTQEILDESKVPTGILVSEVKEQSPKKFFSFNLFKKKEEKVDLDDEELELDNLTLDSINEMIGEPVDEKLIDKSIINKGAFDKSEKMKDELFYDKKNCVISDEEQVEEKKELSEEEIRKLAWGGK